MTRIAVFGLGEAGRIFADGLAGSAEVVGFDPAWRGEQVGFQVATDPRDAVIDADLVLVMTSGSAATAVFDDIAPSVPRSAVYADLSTASPTQKRMLSERARERGFAFADVTLLAPVPRAGLATPAQASGDGSAAVAQLLNPLGARLEVIDGPAGDAAARKLLRSMVVKGLTALLIESLRTAESLDLLGWFSDHIDETLTGIDTAFLQRLIQGTSAHSARRVHEMQAAMEMIEHVGGRAYMAEATRLVLGSAHLGIPSAGVLAPVTGEVGVGRA